MNGLSPVRSSEQWDALAFGRPFGFVCIQICKVCCVSVLPGDIRQGTSAASSGGAVRGGLTRCHQQGQEPVPANVFQELLDSLTHRSMRAQNASTRGKQGASSDQPSTPEKLQAGCECLLASDGELTTTSLARFIFDTYDSLRDVEVTLTDELPAVSGDVTHAEEREYPPGLACRLRQLRGNVVSGPEHSEGQGDTLSLLETPDWHTTLSQEELNRLREVVLHLVSWCLVEAKNGCGLPLNPVPRCPLSRSSGLR